MLFKVKDAGYTPNPSEATDIAYLIIDEWNDWWKYKTMYFLIYVDSLGKNHEIGMVKIGEFQMEEYRMRPNIPKEFEDLDEHFFSVGQSDYYYEYLNNIPAQVGEKILRALNDIALNEVIFKKAILEEIATKSLLRDVTQATVKKQFRRIANGGARLTKYNFTYTTASIYAKEPMRLEFHVVPESNPPTNIHVLIGRNGVGKTRLIHNMISEITDNKKQNEGAGIFSADEPASELFANIICVAFSAFDEFDSKLESSKIPYIHIGLPRGRESNTILSDSNLLSDEFKESLKACSKGTKRELWKKAIAILESDPIFHESGVNEIIDFNCESKELEIKFLENASSFFKKLSSGHKIILLTITMLIENVEEKSLVFLDEPEGHLHPPLLSAFVRALSDLLINRNGVAIIATHSPVILQEVPKSCVWKLRRTGREAKAERLDIESFGENIGALTSEIFGLEVTHSGFHKMLNDAVEGCENFGFEYEVILNQFKGELGMEARCILKALLAVKNNKGD